MIMNTIEHTQAVWIFVERPGRPNAFNETKIPPTKINIPIMKWKMKSKLVFGKMLAVPSESRAEININATVSQSAKLINMR